MPNNVLSSIANIVDFNNYDLSSYATTYQIRINLVGERLEYFIKDSIANSFRVTGTREKEESHSQIFSWLGNQNNPPDIIIRGGDALEIKKTGGLSTSIQLNSAHPKNLLYRDDSRLTSQAKASEEEWVTKDIFYIMGQVEGQQLKHLFYIQGRCYAADRETYQRMEKNVSSAITNADLEFQDTNELGRVNRVDPLGITGLRIRGMWIIQHPVRVFNSIYNPPESGFGLAALMLKEKFYSFPETDRRRILNHGQIYAWNTRIKSPNNPAEWLESILIVYPPQRQAHMGWISPVIASM